MVIDSMQTLEAYASKENDSSAWINASSGIFITSAAYETADRTRQTGQQRQKTDGESKRTRESCGLERVDGNVTGLMALSIK